jgi:hypothetical protein
MGSVDGKTPTKPKLYLFFPNLRHMNKMKLILCALFNYNMSGKNWKVEHECII